MSGCLTRLFRMLPKIILSTAPKPIKHFITSIGILPKILSILVIIFSLAILSFYFYYSDKILPGIYMAGIQLSGKTLLQAENQLSSLTIAKGIALEYEKQDFSLNLKDAGLVYKADKSALRAFQHGRKNGIRESLKQEFQAITQGANLPLVYELDQSLIDNLITKIAGQVDIPAIEPSVSINENIIVVNPGKNGHTVDKNNLKHLLYQAIAYQEEGTITIPVIKTNPKLTPQEAELLKIRAEKLLGKSIIVEFEGNKFTYLQDDLISLLEPNIANKVRLEKISTLVQELSSGLNREPQNARFEFEEGRVKEFQPAKDGIEVDQDATIQKISDALQELENTDKIQVSFVVPVGATKPLVDNAEVNNLGINELIGKGESSFKGSVASRVHNIKLATTRLNGLLIKPGEEFSFNTGLGEVTTSTGYQQAFVIKQGRTILDDGGGVCQVSTTFFRAALYSGLPIIERHPHSYRVSYYEQGTKAGLDATIYQPGIDLKIKNDTPAHILIQTKLDLASSHLIFEFYGTSDGRVAEISTPRIWDITPPPPDLYQDDPTLPTGTTKQIERAISGAKAAFDYKVTRGDEVLQKRTFYSNYKAWQAVYLRGTATQ